MLKFSNAYLPSTLWKSLWIQADVPTMKGTLKIHMLKRNIVHIIPGIELFELASDSTPYLPYWYKSEVDMILIMSMIIIVDVVDSVYTPAENDWLKCPICAAWFHEECF